MDEVRVVAGMIVRDGRVLVARRAAGMRHAGAWEFPGGKVEPGEDDPTALVRELNEELGVVVAVGPYLAEAAVGAVRLILYRCVLVEGEPTPLEHADLRWMGPNDLTSVEWAPGDVPLLDRVRSALV